MAKQNADTQQTLIDRLDEEGARGWQPNAGDTILGTVLNIKPSQPNEYGIYPIVTIQVDDGERVALHCFHNVLRNRMIEKRPHPGERIAVKYHGEVTSKKNDRTYNSYAVVVDRPEDDSDSAASWDDFGAADETES